MPELTMAPVPRSIDMLMDLQRRSVQMPWHGIKQWNPFKIDALGLITLLGADEVNQSIGTLQRRRFTEYLPLLAAFIVAGDRFNSEQPGFALYNITDGITTTELKGWFTRWLTAQKIRTGTTVFRWHVREKPHRFTETQMIAPLLSFIAIAPLYVKNELCSNSHY